MFQKKKLVEKNKTHILC